MAQYKHKDPFDFLNTAKMLWACNKLPPASEDTIAYYRRFIILQLNKCFLGPEADIHLLDKLTTPEELSGLLNYALEGLKRLLTQGRFSSSNTIEQTRLQYIRTSDSCMAFIEETTEIDIEPDAYIADDVLYAAYVTYCRTNRLPVQKKAQLTIALQKTRPEATHTVLRVLGKNTHVWKFLKTVPTATTATASLYIANFESKFTKGEVPVAAVAVDTPAQVETTVATQKNNLKVAAVTTPEFTIQEVKDKVAAQLATVFQEEKLLTQIMGLGYDREEAQKRVDHFKQKGLVVEDDVGGWHWA
jgi:phage/plasmid-associated DNA primase